MKFHSSNESEISATPFEYLPFSFDVTEMPVKFQAKSNKSTETLGTLPGCIGAGGPFPFPGPAPSQLSHLGGGGYGGGGGGGSGGGGGEAT